MIVTSPAITECLQRAGFSARAHVAFGDEPWRVPTPGEIKNELGGEIQKAIRKWDFNYVASVRDCDDFARGAAFICQFLNSRANSVAVAFGEVWCAALAHAFNLAIHHDDDAKLYVAFYEPQKDEFGFCLSPLELNREQIESIYEVRF